MAIQVRWDDDARRVVIYEFDERWTWEEFFGAVEQARALIDTAPGGVGVIMDGKTRSMQFPPNMLTNARRALSNTHPRTRIVVVVINNPFLHVMITTLSRISGARGRVLKIADTLEEARALVNSHLDSLSAG